MSALRLESLESRFALATIEVNSLTDGTLAQLAGDNNVSLREAIEAANSNRSIDGSVAGQSNQADTITFAPNLEGTIKLTAGQLVLAPSVTIAGPGAKKLILDGDLKSRLFQVEGNLFESLNVVIRDLSMTRGRATAQLGGHGGAIYSSGRLTLERVAITDSVASREGGGIYSSNELNVVASTIASNVADFRGGGIASDGKMNIQNSTVAANSVLETRPSGTQSKLRINTQLRSAVIDGQRVEPVNNRIAIERGSTVAYEGLGITTIDIPNIAGDVSVFTNRMVVTAADTSGEEKFFQAENVEVDVTITDVETGDDGVLVIDDLVNGNTSQDDKIHFNLSIGRSERVRVAKTGGRTYTLKTSAVLFKGSANANDVATKDVEVTLSVSPPEPSDGGGIYNRGQATISNSSITGNIASGVGAGIYNTAQVDMSHTIVAGNRQTTGIVNDVAGSGAFASTSSFNLLGTVGTSGLVNGSLGNVINVDWLTVFESDGINPQLKDNGGPTATVALIEGSRAVDSGSPTIDETSLPTDQRGLEFVRVLDGDRNGSAVIDIGAYERAIPKFDYGDAPSLQQSGLARSYPVLYAQNGARHSKSSLFLGDTIDDELDGIPESKAGTLASGGDDNSGVDDEDGIVALTTVLSGDQINIASLLVKSSGPGKVDAWVDYDRDGDWTDLAEQVLNSAVVSAGDNVLSIQVPTGATSGDTFARFRLSSGGGLTPNGVADDGEVEDMMLTISSRPAVETAFVQLFAAGNYEVMGQKPIGQNTSIKVQKNGQILFEAASVDAPSFSLLGSNGSDTINLNGAAALPIEKLSFQGALGFDTLKLIDSGFAINLPLNPAALAAVERLDITGTGKNELRLDKLSVEQMVGNAGTLSIIHDADDFIEYGADWQVQVPQLTSSEFLHVLIHSNKKIEIRNDRAFHNPYIATDINFSGEVSAIDALLIINRINNAAPQQPNTPVSAAELLDFQYFDANGDSFVTAIDVLLVINQLNLQANGESESSTSSEEYTSRWAVDFWEYDAIKKRATENALFATALLDDRC